MKKIPSAFIKSLISSSNIYDIISRFVKLKKTGKNFLGLCPFHNEKTPSFSVNDEKQVFHCFGCGSSGDVISFLSKHENISFIESIEELASIQGSIIPYENDSNSEKYINSDKVSSKILEIAKSTFITNLKDKTLNVAAIQYLKNLEIKRRIVDEYNLGLSSRKRNDLKKNLENRFSYCELKDSGLFYTSKNNNLYDLFKDRLMFPIINRQGSIIGFGGRSLHNGEKIKYLNSPDSTTFTKGKELYGLYELKKRNFKKNICQKIVIVEGYMDVISLANHGYFQSVAILGTSLTKDHLKILFRETNDIVLSLDGDSAGKEAVLRSMKNIFPLLNNNRDVFVLSLPDSHDPDSFTRKYGIEQFKRLITLAPSISKFFFELIKKKFDFDSVTGVSKCLEYVKDNFKEARKNIFFITSIIRKLSETLDIPFENIYKTIIGNKVITQDGSKRFQERGLDLIEKCLAYMLNLDNSTISFIKSSHFENMNIISRRHSILRDTIVLIKTKKNLNSSILINYLLEKYKNYKDYFYEILNHKILLKEDDVIKELIGIFKKIDKENTKVELNNLIRKSKIEDLKSEDKKRIAQILKNIF